MNEKVIAIDPGREKCGVAVVTNRKEVMYKKVVNTAELAETIMMLADRHGVAKVIIGDRTAHKAAQLAVEALSVNGTKLSVETIDEHRSSEEARARYWLDNPPRGFFKLIPVTMRIPPVPVDDYVAVILAERYFRLPG